MMSPSINLLGAIVASFAAGYAMAFVGYWFEGVFGLAKFDLRTIGEIYVGTNDSSSWWAGAAAHFAESILLAVVYAAAIARLGLTSGILPGLAFGTLLFIVGMAATIVGRKLDGVVFLRAPLTRGYVATNLLQHFAYGAVLGIAYLSR